MTVRRYTEVYELIGEGVTEPIFPKSQNKFEKFRTVSHVVLQRRAALAAAQGDGPPPKLVVSNLFVCSGQKHHKVPGKKAATKVKFKMRVVTKGIQKAVRFAERQAGLAARLQGQRIDFLTAGDYNLHREAVRQALETVQCKEGGVVKALNLHCVQVKDLLPRQEGKQRDFIVCSRRCG